MNWKKLACGLAAAILWGVSVTSRAQIVTFEFSTLLGGETTATNNSKNANLNDCVVSRGFSSVAANGGRFNATNWAITSVANAVSGGKYMEFTITPNSGYQFNVSSIFVQWQRSSTGNRGVSLRSSADGYASDIGSEWSLGDVTTTQSNTWTFTQGDSTTPVSYRLYSWAEAVTGSGGPGDGVGNDIVVYGAVSAAGGGVPEFTSGLGPYGATTGVAMAFTVAASGSPTPTLALQSQTASSGFAFTAGTGQLSYTPPQADGGATQTFTFTASNSAGVATQTVSVAVTAATTPSFTSGASYGATTGVARAFTVAASGTPAPTLTLQSEDAAGDCSFTPGTGLLTYTPAAGDVGTRTFTFTASNVAGVATQAVSVTVADVAVAPSFTGGTSYGATSLVAMAFAVAASGNPAPTLALQSQTASSGFGFTAGTGVLDYTPPTNDVGTRTFTFTASNSAGVATQTVSVAVAAAPTAIPAVSVANIDTNSFTVNWTTCTDATNYQVQVATDTNFTVGAGGTNVLAEDFATLTDTAVPSGWTCSKSSDLDYTGEPYVGAALPAYKFATTGQWLTSPTFAAGATNLQFWAYGNGGAGSTIAVSALVSGVWTLMDTVAIAQNDGTYNVALNPQTTQLAFIFTKSVNCAFDDVVVQGAAGGGSIVADATVAALTYGATGLVMETTYYVRARKEDGEWSSIVSATTASPAPEAPAFGANPGPLTVTTGVARAFAVAAAGFPSPTLALAGTTASSGYSFTAGTGQLTYTAPEADVGARTFTFTASNATGVATQTVGVTVVAVAPSFGANPGPVAATATLARVFTVAASGNPAPTLALAGTTASSGYGFTAGTGQLAYTPPEADVGARTFTFTASNVAGVATQVVDVSVAAAPSYIPTVSVTNIGTNSFTANWTEVTDATTYQIQIGTDTNFSGATGGTNVLSETFAALTDTAVPSGWSNNVASDLDFTSEPYVGAAAPAYKFGTTGQWLLSPTFATGATNLQFWAYGRNGSGSTFAISGLVSGVWTLLDTVSIARNEATYNVPLDPQTTRLKFTFTKIVNCGLDDVVVQSSSTVGSLILDETVAALTYGAMDLDLLTAYYVRVRAAPTGTWSTIVQATTLGTDPVLPWFTGGAGPYSTTAGVSVAFTESAMGVPAPVLALAGSTAAGGSYAFTPEMGYFIYTPPLGDAGAQTFTFTASNGMGITTQTVSVSVTAATAPTFVPMGTQYATTLVTRVFIVEAAGAPAPILELAGSSATAGSYNFSPEVGRLSYTAPTNDTGTQTFTFTAGNLAGVATQIVSVVVSNMPAAAPTIDAIPPQTTMVGLEFTHTVTATDPDTAASNLTFACTSAVASAAWAFDTNSGYFVFIPTTNQVGTNVFSFQATDHPTSLTSPWSNMTVVVSAAGDPVSVSFGSARIVGEEDGGTISIPVSLAYSGSASVQFRFIGPTNGTAQRGVDFNCATTLVVSGAASGNLVLTLVNDALPEGPESIKIQLAPVSPATAGSVTQAVLYVRDDDTVSIMAANTTSGANQEYEGPGNRIFQALCPDVALIQEFSVTNGTTSAAYRAWVDQNFGTNFDYYVQTGVSIPNGVVSRWPISSGGVWDDTTLTDRDFVWAKIQLPGTQQLQAVSLHIKASSTSADVTQRTTEGRLLTNYIAQAGWLTNGAYIAIGGDFNLYSTNEAVMQVLSANTITDKHQPADQFGDKETNSARENPYDRVLPSTNLDARARSFSLWGYNYANGIVYDTRIVWASGLPLPSLAADSAAVNMQHMAVMKVFELEKDVAVDDPVAFSAAAAGQSQIDLAFTRNSVGDDVVVVWDTDGTFTAPTGTAPAVGASFAGGTVAYKGGVSPQSHTGLTSCATYHYKCWSYAGTVYSSNGLTASATTAEPSAPAFAWAGSTNTTSFMANWSAVAGAGSYLLDVSTSSSFSGAGAGWQPIFRETMGVSSGTVTLAEYEAANGFDNDAYAMGAGGADSPADIRSSSASTNYVDPAGNACSAGANVYFTTTGVSGAVGFGIEGIDTRGYQGLSLSFGYRKESASANMLFTMDWSTNAGAAWNPIVLSNMPAENAAGIWYMVSNLTVSSAAIGSTNLSLRWVRAAGAQPGRIDDVLLQGYTASAEFVPGYSNRTVSGATSQSVTGLTAGATYFFRVAAVAGCTSAYSPVADATTLAAPAFGANPGPIGATVGVASVFTVVATGGPEPTLALAGTTASSGYGFAPATGQLSYTPTTNDVGVRTFTFTASNASGVATQIVSVSVSDLAAEAPVFTSGASYGATTSVARTFTVVATGYPPPALALVGTTASGGYGFTPATGVLAYTPPEADVGARTFTFTAGNASGVATQTVSVAVVAGIPAPPASIWASATNILGFTAAWSAAPLATSYRLDVSTSPTFQIIDAAGTQWLLASNAASSPSVITNGWSGWNLSLGSSNYVTMTQSTSVVTSPAFSTVGFTNLTVDFRARTFGGSTKSNITVSISTNDGSSWIVMSVASPSNGSEWVSMPTLTNVANVGHGQTRIRWQSLDASTNMGVGISNLVVMGWAPNVLPSTVPGYSDLAVAGTSQAVTGLTANSTYYFRVRSVNANGSGANSSSANVTTLPKSNQTIDFPALGDWLTTDVVGLSATASSGLAVSFAVAGGPALITDGTLTFTNAGTVRIVASQAGNASWNAAPDVTNVFAVTKETASVWLEGLAPTYDGTARTVTATTMPAGLTVTITYDGAGTVPVNAGSYAVTGTVSDAMYQGSASGTLVVSKAAATVTLGDLAQVYDGSARVVSATTDPAGLTVALTYGGNAWAPTNAGSYAVTGTVSAANYHGSTVDVLVVSVASQTIDFPALGDQLATNVLVLSATASSGLPVSFAVAGGPAAIMGGTLSFSGEGSVSLVASQAGDGNWSPAPEATNVFSVTKVPATVTLGNLTQSYDGTAKSATATTEPAGLAVDVTYDGHAWAPTNAGSYTVVATLAEALYQGSVTGTLMISQASESAVVALFDLDQTYDGTPKAATATTDPEGLEVEITYDGSATAPTAAGSYAVTGTVKDLNYEGWTNGTLVIAKAAAEVTLSDLNHDYDGTAKSATATTVPAGLSVSLTYDGSAAAPTATGSYEVVATVVEANYAGSATGILVIAQSLTPFQLWVRDDQGQSLSDPNYATNADYDNDGMTTWQEYLADTEPDNSNSVLALTGQYFIVSVSNAAGKIRMSFPASTNRYYQLIYSTNLSSPTLVNNLGWGTPGMAITNNSQGTWYGRIRSLLAAP